MVHVIVALHWVNMESNGFEFEWNFSSMQKKVLVFSKQEEEHDAISFFKGLVGLHLCFKGQWI